MAYKYKEYEESDAVKQAKANLDAQLAKKPGAYTSQWQAQLDDVLGKIQNREKFSYNVNGDALYQNYKDRFVQQGQQAMQDTMGQAAALTGGYGSSYSQNAGQQAYHGYLQGLNDVVPELYQIALDRYNQEGENMLNMYGILGDKEAQDYGRWQDALSAYERERDYLAGLYDAERGYDYGRYSDDRDLAYSQYRDQVADEQWEKQFAYAKERDKIADEQWAKQFAASQAARYVVDNDDDGTKWGKGISTDKSKNEVKKNAGGALKGSAWDYSKNNMSRLLVTGDYANAEKYMDMIVDQLSQEQYNEIISMMKKSGFKFD